MGIRHRLPPERWPIVLLLPLSVPTAIIFIDGEVTTFRPVIAFFSSAAFSGWLYEIWQRDPINIISADEVLEATDGEPMSVPEIADKIPYSERTVRKRMKSLVQEGTYETGVVAGRYTYQQVSTENAGLGSDSTDFSPQSSIDRNGPNGDVEESSEPGRSKSPNLGRVKEQDQLVSDSEPVEINLDLGDCKTVTQDSEIVYVGNKGDNQVYADGEPIDPATDIVNHSHTGDLSWGYSGSGPAQLAAALIADAVGPEAARKHYYDFYADVTSNLPDSFELSADEIRAYVEKAEERETASS